MYGLKSYDRGLLTIDTVVPNGPTTFGQAQAWWVKSLAIERDIQPQWLRDLVADSNEEWTLSRGLAAFYFVDLYGDVLWDLAHMTYHKMMWQDIRDTFVDMSVFEQRNYLLDLKMEIENDTEQEVERKYNVEKDQFLDEIDRVL